MNQVFNFAKPYSYTMNKRNSSFIVKLLYTRFRYVIGELFVVLLVKYFFFICCLMISNSTITDGFRIRQISRCIQHRVINEGFEVGSDEMLWWHSWLAFLNDKINSVVNKISWTSNWLICCYRGCHKNDMEGWFQTVSCVHSKRLWRHVLIKSNFTLVVIILFSHYIGSSKSSHDSHKIFMTKFKAF